MVIPTNSVLDDVCYPQAFTVYKIQIKKSLKIWIFNLAMPCNTFSEILIKIRATSKTTNNLQKNELRVPVYLIFCIVVGIMISIITISIFLIYIYIRIKKITSTCAMQSNDDFTN